MWINQFETESFGQRGRWFFEPLNTKAPRAGVKPYCCMVDQVIFYAFPYYVTTDGTRLVEYERTTHQWNLFGERFMDGQSFDCFAPLVLHDGEVYELASGRPVRHAGKWCMQWLGWKIGQTDWRWHLIQVKVREVVK